MFGGSRHIAVFVEKKKKVARRERTIILQIFIYRLPAEFHCSS